MSEGFAAMTGDDHGPGLGAVPADAMEGVHPRTAGMSTGRWRNTSPGTRTTARSSTGCERAAEVTCG